MLYFLLNMKYQLIENAKLKRQIKNLKKRIVEIENKVECNSCKYEYKQFYIPKGW